MDIPKSPFSILDMAATVFLQDSNSKEDASLNNSDQTEIQRRLSCEAVVGLSNVQPEVTDAMLSLTSQPSNSSLSSTMISPITTSDFWSQTSDSLYEHLSVSLSMYPDVALRIIEEGLSNWQKLESEKIWTLLFRRNEIAVELNLEPADIESEYIAYINMKDDDDDDAWFSDEER